MKPEPATAPIEREAALLVVSRTPERTVRRLASLRRVEDFVLRPRGVARIRDTYLDTPDGRLGARRIALRTRDAGGVPVITLKGPGRALKGVGTRSELELPLTVTSARRVLAALAGLGIEGGLPSARALAAGRWGSADSPLVPSQVRTTRRLLRDVLRKAGGREQRVAELAVDRVVYWFAGARVTLDELEVEAKGGGSERDVRDLTRALLRSFKGELRPWAHSKLATGKALEDRMRRGTLDTLVTRRRHLLPSAVPTLARSLRRD